MTADPILSELAAYCGVFDRFRDLEGVTRPTGPDTQRALLRAEGLAVATDAEVRDTLAGLRADQNARPIPQELVLVCDVPSAVPCDGAMSWHVTLEESDAVVAQGRGQDQIDLPPLPCGVHELHVHCRQTQAQCTLIVAPVRAPSLQDVAQQDRSWGVVAALYGLRSGRNHGVGDFEDLARLAEVLGDKGAGFLGVNPVHALGWGASETISPYSPTHRGFLNTGHLALDRIPGFSPASPPDPDAGALIDYATQGAYHRASLHQGFTAFQQNATAADRDALAAFTKESGTALEDFARFESLSTQREQDWRQWPMALRSPATARAAPLPGDAAFHIWLQWLADRQLRHAQTRARASGMALGLYLDLAVGARLDGAEAWGAGGTLAQGVSMGAPPDHLSPAGQNWQLAAYAPRKLAARKYAPLRQVLRQAMRHCGLLRIDHVLGLNRSYWIPEDGSPGGYIRQPFQSLMAIIAIEAQRAGTLIVGEDLGLVPDGFRDTMAGKGFYGYTVLQYEKTDTGAFRKAKELRPQSLACFGTHDTPTIAGFWAGQDIEWWHKLGWIDDAKKEQANKHREQEKADLIHSTGKLNQYTAGDLRDRVHLDLAEGPAALAAVQLDDLLGVCEAQNLPGTVEAHPNWQRKSRVRVEDMGAYSEVDKTARMMAKARRSSKTTED